MEIEVSILVQSDREAGPLLGALKRHGLRDPAVLKEIGQITGRVEESLLDRLRRLPGIESVERLGSKRAH